MNVYVQFYANTFLAHSCGLHVYIFLLLLSFVAFSEEGDDVILQCPSTKHSIDVKEIVVEEGQVNKRLLS